jgi:hypothetical protein
VPKHKDFGFQRNARRNSPIKAHQINLQRSLIDGTIDRFAGISQLFLVCGRDTERQGIIAGKVVIAVETDIGRDHRFGPLFFREWT